MQGGMLQDHMAFRFVSVQGQHKYGQSVLCNQLALWCADLALLCLLSASASACKSKPRTQPPAACSCRNTLQDVVSTQHSPQLSQTAAPAQEGRAGAARPQEHARGGNSSSSTSSFRAYC
jgi:hypothetical protein